MKFLLIIIFIYSTAAAREHFLNLTLDNGLLPNQPVLLLKLGDKIEFQCPDHLFFILYKVSVSAGKACIVEGESTRQVVAACTPAFKYKFVIRNRNAGNMRRAIFEDNEEGYLISVNSGRKEDNDHVLKSKYGGVCFSNNMKLPFKVISKKEQGTVDVPSHHKAQQNVGLLGDGWSTSRPPRELQQHPEIQTEPLPHREIQQIPQVKVDPIYKYSSQSEDGLFLDPKKEQKVAKYMKDRTGLYLDVKAALATDPTLTHHSRLAYQQVEKYFRGIISIPEEEIRDIVDTFNLHIDSDYDIGYEELSREKIQTTSTLLILSLFIVFVILTVLTLIMVTKHLR